MEPYELGCFKNSKLVNQESYLYGGIYRINSACLRDITDTFLLRSNILLSFGHSFCITASSRPERHPDCERSQIGSSLTLRENKSVSTLF